VPCLAYRRRGERVVFERVEAHAPIRAERTDHLTLQPQSARKCVHFGAHRRIGYNNEWYS
jgi:hypothetical protein